MADTSIQTIRAAIANTDRKVVLAFFLTIIAASLTVWMGNMLVGKNVDAGTAALISGIVMLFVKMAADANGYQTQSSAGSDKKDDAQTAVSKALAEKVPAPQAAPPTAPTVVVSWWSLLTASEQAGIEAAAANDAEVQTILTAFQSGKAEAPDLVKLVVKNLLTQARADIIKST